MNITNVNNTSMSIHTVVFMYLHQIHYVNYSPYNGPVFHKPQLIKVLLLSSLSKTKPIRRVLVISYKARAFGLNRSGKSHVDVMHQLFFLIRVVVNACTPNEIVYKYSKNNFNGAKLLS